MHATARPLLLTLLLLVAATARAGQVEMADGRLGFRVPDAWVDIMDAHGDPEMRVFQVPGSPDGTLAQVSIGVHHPGPADSLGLYEHASQRKAASLPGYHELPAPAGDDSLAYTARDGNTTYTYREIWLLREGMAVQVRCVRPVQESAAGWNAAFDRACAGVAENLAP